MPEKTHDTLDDLLFELHKDPDFRREYRGQASYYELLREVLRWRKELGWTQQELAEKAGTHQSNISRIESGELDVRLSTINVLAEAMGTRVDIRFIQHLDDVDDNEIEKLFKTSSTLSGAQKYADSQAQVYKTAKVS